MDSLAKVHHWTY